MSPVWPPQERDTSAARENGAKRVQNKTKKILLNLIYFKSNSFLLYRRKFKQDSGHKNVIFIYLFDFILEWNAYNSIWDNADRNMKGFLLGLL